MRSITRFALFGFHVQFGASNRWAGRVLCRTAAVAVACAANGAAAGAGTPEPPAVSPLPALAARADGVTVSGISSGGFMAVQFAVAHSALVRGVGAIAAGPYYCAGLDPRRVTSVCLKDGRPDWRDSVAAVDFAASVGSIDAPSNLQSQRAWVLAEGADPVVGPAVVRSTWAFLAHYSGELAHLETLPGAGHSMPTLGQGGRCGLTQPPYVNDCAYDAAGRMLDYLYGNAAPEAEAESGNDAHLLRFDQSEFSPAWRRLFGRTSLAATGLLFVPDRCRRGGCRLHVAFHGCRQGVSQAGDAFARESGYNEWARRHATLVLYPQVDPIGAPWYAPWATVNPEGCWDWWGYSGADYAVRSAPQIEAVEGMIHRLMQPGVSR